MAYDKRRGGQRVPRLCQTPSFIVLICVIVFFLFFACWTSYIPVVHGRAPPRLWGTAVREGQTPTAAGPSAAESKSTPAAGRPRFCDTNPRAFFPISFSIACSRLS